MTNTNSKVENIEEERVFLCLEDEIEAEQNQHSQCLKKEENKVDPRIEQFNKYLTEAIDETLTSLGVPVKNALYENLENNFGLTKKDIPRKICDFSSILHKLFGLGAGRLEVRFMKSLNEKIQADIRWPEYDWPLSKWAIADLSFEEYVFKVREDFIQKK